MEGIPERTKTMDYVIDASEPARIRMSHRLMRVPVQPETLLTMFADKGAKFEVLQGIPWGAKIRDVVLQRYLNRDHFGMIWLVIEHDSFPELEPSKLNIEQIPIFEIKIHRTA
jgi:hypothetical protein